MTALSVNAFSVETIAAAAARARAAFVHYSSDFVFDGETERPYTEDDGPNPRSVYAASKLLGDWFALASPRALVLRVESLFGSGPASVRRGSLGTIVDRIQDAAEVPGFCRSRRLTGLHSRHRARNGPPSEIRSAAGSLPLRQYGPCHVARSRRVHRQRPRQAAACEAFEACRCQPPRPPSSVHCALSNAKLSAAGHPMPTWQEAIQEFLTSNY